MAGKYNPHYEFLESSSPSWKMSKAKRTEIFGKSLTNSIKLCQPEFYPSPKIKGSINFKAQVERDLSPKNNPCESRFVSFNAFPNISTKSKGNKLVKMQLQKPREPIFEGESINTIQYDPKPEFVLERSPKGMIELNSMIKRKDLFKINNTPENVLEENLKKYYRNLSKIKSIPLFAKSPKGKSEVPRYFHVINLNIIEHEQQTRYKCEEYGYKGI